jgi:hypothetical protein
MLNVAMQMCCEAEYYKKKYFKCDHCDKAFSQNSKLTSHVNRIHKKIKSYSCELCSYTSCTKGDLKKHSNRMHNPKKAHRPDLDALVKEAQKDKMIKIVSVEKIISTPIVFI